MPSRFAEKSGSGGSSSRSRFAGSGAKKQDDDDKGVLDFVGNVGEGLKDLAVGTGVGAVTIGKAIGSDAYHGKGIAGIAAMLGPQALVTLPARQIGQGDLWKGGRSDLDKLGEPMAKAFADSLKQTATNPGYWYDHPVDVALNLTLAGGAVAGVGARTGNAVKAAKAGKGAAAVSKELLAPARQTRYVKYIDPVTGKVTDKVVRGAYSKSAQARLVQKGLEARREAGAAKGKSFAYKRNNRAYGKAKERIARTELDIANIPAAQLKNMDARTALGRQKVSDPQLMAVRSVIEQSHPDLYIQKFRNQIDVLKGNPKNASDIRELRSQIRVFEQAKRYVNPDPVNPSIPVIAGNKRLQEMVDRSVSVSRGREGVLETEGYLDPARSAFRESAVGRMLRGAEWDDAGVLVGAEDAPAALARVPFKWGASDRFLNSVKGMGQGGVIGIGREPGTLTGSFKGTILEKGGGSNRVGRIIADDAMEANRFVVNEQARKIARDIGSPDPAVFPRNVKLVGVRMKQRQLTAQESARLKQIIFDNAEKPSLTRSEIAEIKRLDRENFDALFVKTNRPEPIDDIVWVPKDTLGNLSRARPEAAETATGRFLLDSFDTINNFERFAILYAKLGYIFPNLIGNAALLMIQQGPFAIRNLRKLSSVDKYVRADIRAAVDTVMGEGLFSSTFTGSVKNVSSTAVNKFSRAFGRVTDIPFRRASFYHEARVRGHKTPQQIEDLFKNPAKRDDLLATIIEANNDLIDYGRLGPFEKAWIRRIVFFYPWVKGSSRYAGRFVKEHPIQAGLYNQLGSNALEQQKEDLGDLPSYFQGLARIGGTDQRPRVVNTSTISPFATPFQTLQAILSPATGDSALGQMLTPAAGFGNTLISGKNRLGYDPRGETALKTAVGDLYENIPAFLLQKRLTEDPKPDALAQRSERDALLNYLLGGGSPYTLNRSKANQQAQQGR